MKKIIVTGATGFVGHHLVEQLILEEHVVYVLVRNIKKVPCSWINNSKVYVVEISMEEILKLPDRIPERDFDAIFHLAWNGSAGIARSDYRLQMKNVKQSCDLVTVCSKMKCKKFIGIGSIMEDEATKYIPTVEAIPTGNYIYSIAKLMAHYMCKVVANECKMNFCWAKISNAYGADDTTNRFVDMTINKLLCAEECNMTEGKQIYDFVYVTEVARALMCIENKGKANYSYFIGSMNARPLHEFVEIMHKEVNPNAIINYGAVTFTGIDLGKEYYKESNILFEHTGFKCAIDFEEGIRKTVKFKRMCADASV